MEKNIKLYTTKKGEVKKYIMNSHQYYETFKLKNPDKTATTLCACGGQYNYFSKYMHEKSQRHKKHFNINDNI